MTTISTSAGRIWHCPFGRRNGERQADGLCAMLEPWEANARLIPSWREAGTLGAGNALLQRAARGATRVEREFSRAASASQIGPFLQKASSLEPVTARDAAIKGPASKYFDDATRALKQTRDFAPVSSYVRHSKANAPAITGHTNATGVGGVPA